MHYTETYMLGAPLLLLRPYNQLTSGQQAGRHHLQGQLSILSSSQESEDA